jgi:uroporphyrin-III C-methyltransferase/precorrin-2 dehydrogenase/sirohydrochlorin ferrochelatase
VAASKLPSLLATGAQVTLVAPQVIPAAIHDGITIRRRCFRDTDLDGVWFVLAAATPAANARVSRAAKRRRVFVNAVDDPRNGSAYFAATIKRGDFVLALSTSGTAPAMARLMREALESVLPEDIDEWLALAQHERQQWLRDKIPMSDRLPLLVAAIMARYGADQAVASKR